MIKHQPNIPCSNEGADVVPGLVRLLPFLAFFTPGAEMIRQLNKKLNESGPELVAVGAVVTGSGRQSHKLASSLQSIS